MKLSLAGPSYTSQSVVAAAQQTINLYPEAVEAANEPTRVVLYGRPGLKLFATLTPAKIRAMWAGGGRLFVIHGNTESEVFSNGTSSAMVATVAEGTGNPDPAQIFSNGHQLLIISGGNVYCDNGSGPQQCVFYEAGTCNTHAGGWMEWQSGATFNDLHWTGRQVRIDGAWYTVTSVLTSTQADITPAPPDASDVTFQALTSAYPVDGVTGGFLDGYFIVNRVPTPWVAGDPGRQFNISELNEGLMWDPLMFGVKEGHSDYIRSILCDHEQLWLIGTETTEIWANTGDANFPFGRIAGAYIHEGSMATYAPCTVGLTVCWLGGGPNGRTIAYQAQGLQPQRISTHAVEEAWNAPDFFVGDAVSYAYLDAGHLFWVINFWSEQKTWVYDVTSGMWHERAAWDDTAHLYTGYQPWYHAFVPEWGNGKHIVGDPRTGKLYEASPSYFDDDGALIGYTRSYAHLLNEDKYQFHHRFELYLEAGTAAVSAADATVSLDWSDDRGHTFKTPRTATAGLNGDFTKRLAWRRLGRSRDRVYRVSFASKDKVALIDAFLEVTPGGA